MKRVRKLYVGIVFLFLLNLIPTYYFNTIPTANAWHPGMSASTVIGQKDFVSNSYYDEDNQAGLKYPSGITSDGTKMIVADRSDNRVLVWNEIPTNDGTPADVVVGQSSFEGTSSNQGGGTNASTLSSPGGVAIAGEKLIVADSNNHRVLIYNSIPTTSGAAADVVIGQPDMTTRTSGQSAAKLNTPTKASYDPSSGKLFIADTFNHRVLIYNSIPTTNGAAADFVVGQPDMTSVSANQGGTPAANTLRYPNSVRVIENKLIISEGAHLGTSSNSYIANNRVVIYNTIPATNNALADVVVGQPDFSTTTPGSTADKLRTPTDIGYDGTNLLVYDTQNHRVLVYNGIPTTNGQPAMQALGQPNASSGTCYATSASRFCNSGYSSYAGMHYVNGHLLVVNTMRNRVLQFDSLITNATATVVTGQLNFTDSRLLMGQENPLKRYGWVEGIATHRGKLFVSDSANNRVLVYNSMPTSNFASPDVVVGQPDFTSVAPNQGGPAAANTLRYPRGIAFAGEKMIISDSSNNRILIYNTIPTSNNASADLVIGQPDFTTTASGTASASTLLYPDATFDEESGKLLVTEWNRRRVLVFNSLPTTNGAAADVVIGQPDFTSTSAYGGNTIGPDGFSNPVMARVAKGKLFIPDYWNHRILVWNSIPTTNGVPADFVLGQPDFTSNSANQGQGNSSPAANTYHFVSDVTYDGNKFFVNDNGNWRVLIYDDIPTHTNQAADSVIGQSDLVSDDYHQPTAYGFELEYGSQVMAVEDNKLILADAYNNRVLIFTNPVPTAANMQAPSATTNRTPTISWTFSDGDPDDTQSKYRVQLDTSPSFSSGNLRDTGWISSSTNKHIVSSALPDGKWYARVKLMDSQNYEGDWNSPRAMTISSTKPAPQPQVTEQQTANGISSSQPSSTDQPETAPSTAVPQRIRITVDGTEVATDSDTDTVINATSSRPTIRGNAEPGSEVVITIEGIGEFKTTADSSGKWSYTPDSDLADGTYPVTIVTTDPAGNVLAETGFVLGVSTVSAQPTEEASSASSGNPTNWVKAASVIALLLMIGRLIALWRRSKKKPATP